MRYYLAAPESSAAPSHGDPDAPTARQIAQTVARHLGHYWDEVLLDGTAPEGLGDHPWDFRPPTVLSTAASLEPGYEPVGSYAETIPEQIDWLLASAASGADPVAHDRFLRQFLDYRLEDTFVHP